MSKGLLAKSLYIFLALLIAAPLARAQYSDAVSRELTVFSVEVSDFSFFDAVSRELSVFFDPVRVLFEDAISREFSVFNDPTTGPPFPDAISRELSVFNDPTPPVLFPDAISRELSVFNDAEPPLPFPDGISREFSVFNAVPDLRVTDIAAPATGLPRQRVDVSWTVVNQGQGVAEAPWVDRVYLSPDPVFGDSNDRSLGDFPYTSSLASGASVTRTQEVSLPTVPGTYWIILVTDATGKVTEETGESNNVTVDDHAIDVPRTAVPDLTVQAIEAPDTAFFDQTIAVRWTVRNIGTVSTDAAEWRDRLFLSEDRTIGNDALQLDVVNVSYLDAGEAYVASADVRIPRGRFGAYYILVKTDNGNAVEEENENNNTLDRPIQLQVPPLPDLQVPLVQAPEEAFPGQPMLLNWRVENRGTGNTPPDQRAWSDGIYLSRDDTFNPATDRFLGSRRREGALPPGEGYTVSGFSVTIPRDVAGDWYVFVWTDQQNSVYEFVKEKKNTNKDRARPPLRIRVIPPDLVVASVTAPANATAARQITVGWTVRNQGAFDAGPAGLIPSISRLTRRSTRRPTRRWPRSRAARSWDRG